MHNYSISARFQMCIKLMLFYRTENSGETKVFRLKTSSCFKTTDRDLMRNPSRYRFG